MQQPHYPEPPPNTAAAAEGRQGPAPSVINPSSGQDFLLQ